MRSQDVGSNQQRQQQHHKRQSWTSLLLHCMQHTALKPACSSYSTQSQTLMQSHVQTAC
jgi:hypothetical protein